MNQNRFLHCCAHPIYENFGILHKPKPINIGDVETKIIENLLWYVPNIDSTQSNPEPILKSMFMDDFCFDFIIDRIGMHGEDVLWVEQNIDQQFLVDYDNRVCVNCQKLLLQKNRSETKVSALLRHLRNCIAHGRFNIVDGMIIGIDAKKDRTTNSEMVTGIVKLRPDVLLKALDELCNEKYAERVYAFALEKNGYTIEYGKYHEKPEFDIVASKNGQTFIFEFKMFAKSVLPVQSAQRFIHDKQLWEEKTHREASFIYVIDENYLSSFSKDALASNGIRVIPKRDMKKVLYGNEEILYNMAQRE